MPQVQLFATCLGDLALPGRASPNASRCSAQAGFDVVFPQGQVCCGQPAFNSGHRAAARRVARTFVRAFSRDAAGRHALRLVRDDGWRCYLPELLGCEPFDVWELSAFLDAQRRRAPPRNDGPPRRLPRLVPHAARAADRRRAATPARALGSRARPAAAARPVLRLRRNVLACASPRSRSRWPTTSSPAPPECDALVTRGSRLPDAPSRPRREDSAGAVRVVHLATALARGVDALSGLEQRPRGEFRGRSRAAEARRRRASRAALDQATGRMRGSDRLGAGVETQLRGRRGARAHARTRRGCASIDDLDTHVRARSRAARGGAAARSTVRRAHGGRGERVRRRGLPAGEGRRSAAKSKSMVTEEIGLNGALEAAGVRVVETDLGEYILQLAGEHPVHIIAPAIEKTAERRRRAARPRRAAHPSPRSSRR